MIATNEYKINHQFLAEDNGTPARENETNLVSVRTPSHSGHHGDPQGAVQQRECLEHPGTQTMQERRRTGRIRDKIKIYIFDRDDVVRSILCLVSINLHNLPLFKFLT